MTRVKTAKRASLMIDVIMAVGLTMLLTAMFYAATLHYAQAARLDDARTELRRAAESELLRLRAAGFENTSETPAPASSPASDDEIQLEREYAAGTGEWIGMTCVTVRAIRPCVGGTLRIELSAYLPPSEDRP